MTSYPPQRIDVPGGWIYHGGPLSHPVLVSDPSEWAPAKETAIVLAAIATLNAKLETIMATLADIQTAETEEASAIDDELAVLAKAQSDLASAQAAGDPAAIQDVVDKMHASTAKLRAALPAPSGSIPTPPAAA